MRKQLALIAAAAMTVSGISLSTHAEEMADDGAAVKADAENAVDRAGDRLKDTADKVGDKVNKVLDGQGLHGTAMAPDAEGIRDILASATEAALTRGGFDDLVERLNDHDRNRIGEFAERDFDRLDGRIAQIQKAWEEKYGEKFDIKDEEAVYPESFARIIQGELGDQARLASERMPQGDLRVEDADKEADRGDRAMDKPDDPAAADKNLDDRGRNTATIRVAESHGLPALTVKMLHEMPDNWRIDIDDAMTGQQLHDNLLAHLTQFGDDSANWPADKTEAYRLASHHVLAALAGKTVE